MSKRVLTILGIRPFQEPPRTSDNTDLDYYAILGLDCKVHCMARELIVL